jgi:hypothetical protein
VNGPFIRLHVPYIRLNALFIRLAVSFIRLITPFIRLTVSFIRLTALFIRPAVLIRPMDPFRAGIFTVFGPPPAVPRRNAGTERWHKAIKFGFFVKKDIIML